MYISHKKKFVILRNRKCASTSLVNVTEQYCEVNYKTAESQLGLSYSEIRHYNAEQLVALFNDKGWDIEDYSVVQTIRNPWDRVVSAFHYEKDVVKNAKLEGFTFDEYLDSKIFKNFAKANNFKNVCFVDGGAKLVPTIIMKVENIDEDIKDFFKKYLDSRVTSLEKKNTTQRGDYKKYYNDESRALIENLFASDIEFGNYTF